MTAPSGAEGHAHRDDGGRADHHHHDDHQDDHHHDHQQHHGHGHDHDHDLGVHAADFAWKVDHIELTTVGIDIGSATSHVMFAHVLLERESSALSSRFVVVGRKVLHRAPALLTPYVSGDQIDTRALQGYVRSAYAAAGQTPYTVDTGVVILTGVALQRRNARAIANLFADEGGKFVCAAAGHRLEALLAAHGSGSVSRSLAGGTDVLNVDVGGGTTKYAAISAGKVVATCAVDAGGRLVAWDADGVVRRIEPAARSLADSLGIVLELGHPLAVEARQRLAAALVDRIFAVLDHTIDDADVLSGGLPESFEPASIVLSGGVSQLMRSALTERSDFNDLGMHLAEEIARRFESSTVPVTIATDALHATVVGAAQFTAQVSGNTLHISDPDLLPARDVPVAVVDLRDHPEPDAEQVRAAADAAVERLDLGDRTDAIALVLDWDGIPRHGVLLALARGLHDAHLRSARAAAPLFIAVTADVAANLGRIIEQEIGMTDGVAVIDGVELSDLDYLDIGQLLLPSNVVPLMIKSLLFAPREVSTV